ncbi:MAG: bifunctional proline dehydrogenase/L-glutamate gamma-semialdehyde dehydrogenase PutA [Burkholderiales bacterium]|nr:MAG: bifunctional proline dehydrogenase/L-glutamate gamma-semialdehyde dehydrogenase PutA [Burkholderiales bacterium]
MLAPADDLVRPQARLPYPYRDEIPVVRDLADRLTGCLDWDAIVAMATPWVEAVRRNPAPFWAMESLLREYPITTTEGLALMRLAEALLRVPDTETAIALTADQLGRAGFEAAHEGPHRVLAQLSASAIALSKRLLPEGPDPPGLLQRLGAQTVVAATVRAIQLLGRQFVLGREIGEAMAEAAAQRGQPAVAQPAMTADQPIAGGSLHRSRLRFSYDMLGEGARTGADAQRYFAAYRRGIEAIGGGRIAASPQSADGISIKLSALFARFEDAQRGRVFGELLPRIAELVAVAAGANLNLTIDAEESERLELSLDLFEAIARQVANAHPHWQGFGLAVQAYQTRALEVVDEVARIARSHHLHFMVRLAKGAYWDTEIKRAQELGLAGYPVFTYKHHTDIAYLACAQALIGHADVLYPQFATHNAGTIAAILQMARGSGAAFEFQRLHGMAEGVYREVLADLDVPLRIYAPVGEHRDLLAYLVRRLLENGANSSFVHQLADASVGVESLLANPISVGGEPSLPLPHALYGAQRMNSRGVDLACVADRAPLEAALATQRVQAVGEATPAETDAAMTRLAGGFAAWNGSSVTARAATLRRAADALEARMPEFCALLVREAGRTLGDAVAEVREAVDFCRYYAQQACALLAPQALPGPTGENNTLELHGRGVFVCISPWNFPLAIFTGQVVAALVTGNAVAAKPAEQTPYVAQRMVELLHEAGVPRDALAALHGPGETVGARLVADTRTAGVCFTGSTAVARSINRSLADKDGPLVPLIAETGGINAMIVDSTALPEQVTDAVMQSAFRSAGQRCSALRLLAVHESIADALIEMIRGALAELQVGDPADLATDVGPLIDDEAFATIAGHVQRLRQDARYIGEAQRVADYPRLQPPIAFEVARISDVTQEVFGPVLHVVRYDGPVEAVLEQIHALGYGLTMGIQTRIDSRARRLAGRARIGNVYVNRNMIGAVVGVQPFGGEGLSGTGPKAGGPHYLPRFCAERTVTVNTAAAGGNAELLAGMR